MKYTLQTLSLQQSYEATPNPPATPYIMIIKVGILWEGDPSPDSRGRDASPTLSCIYIANMDNPLLV